MTRSEALPKGRRTQLVLRLGVLALLLVGGVVLLKFTPLGEFFERERIIGLLESLRTEPWMPVALILAFGVSTIIGLPASPLVLAGGMVFGPVLGAVYNILGLVLGAMATFWVGRALGRDAILQLAGSKLRRAEMVFNRRGFWPLVQARFLPIPFPVVSYAAALAGIPTLRFFVTTVIGVVPAMMVHTYFGPQMILAGIEGRDMRALGLGYIVAVVLLNVFAVWPQVQERLRRRRRYRDILRERAEQGR